MEATQGADKSEDEDVENKDEAVVHEFSKVLHTERHINDDLYSRAVSILGEAAVVDLTGILGYYSLISMTINVFKVPAPDDTLPEFGL